MILLHKANRVDNNEEVKGFLTKMWGEYHIILQENENLAYPVIPDTICPCIENLENKFIISGSDKRKYLIIAENEDKAKIKFSQNLPSLKIRNIKETEEDIFNIIE